MPRDEWFNYVRGQLYTMVSEHVQECKGMRDEFGNTALICAVLSNDTAMVRILVQHEAGLVSVTGKTALHTAILAGNAELCYILAPLEWSIPTSQRRSPLMLAAEVGNVDVLTVLLPYSNMDRDAAGFSALDLAVLSARKEVVKILLIAQCPTGEDLMNALSLAKTTPQPDILILLERQITETSTASCNQCMALKARVARQEWLLEYLNILLAQYQQKPATSLSRRASPVTGSTTTPVVSTPRTASNKQGVHSGASVQLPSVKQNAQQKMTSIAPVPLFLPLETPERSSSSLVKPGYVTAPSRIQHTTPQDSFQNVAQTQNMPNISNFQELNATFQLLAANYAQLKKKQDGKNVQSAALSTENRNIFNSQMKGTLGGDNNSDINFNSNPDPDSCDQLQPATPTSVKRKLGRGTSPKSNRLFRKQYMELDETPIVSDNYGSSGNLLNDSPLHQFSAQQRAVSLPVQPPSSGHQPIILPTTPHMAQSLNRPFTNIHTFEVPHNIPVAQEKKPSTADDATPGTTSLMQAAMENNLALGRSSIGKESRRQREDGVTALMLAAKHGSLELVHLLSSAEAKMQDNAGYTALHHAAMNDQVNTFKILYYHERDIIEHMGHTAEELAAIHNSSKILAYLSELKKASRQASPVKQPQQQQVVTPSVQTHSQVVSQTPGRTGPASRKIDDIIAYYKEEAIKKEQGKTSERKGSDNTSNFGIPPSVSLSVYGAQSPNDQSSVQERHSNATKSSITSPRNNSPNAGTSGRPRKPPIFKLPDEDGLITAQDINIIREKQPDKTDTRNNIKDNSAIPPSNLIRVGSNLHLRPESLFLEKTNFSNLATDDSSNTEEHSDEPVRERMKPQQRSRSNSANIKSHSPLASGKTELMICVEADDFDMGKSLIEKMAGRGDRNGNTALMYAAKLNRTNFAAELAKIEAGYVNYEDQTAYEIAMAHNNYAVAGILRPYEKHLVQGSPERKYSSKDFRNAGPLNPATFGEYDSIFNEPTMSANASINIEVPLHPLQKNKDQCSMQELTLEMLTVPDDPPQAAHNSPKSNVPNLRPKEVRSTTPLIDAVKYGSTAEVKKHLQDFAGIADTMGMTALMYAAELGNKDATMVLRTMEAKIRVSHYRLNTFYDLSNATALMIAVAKNNLECVKALAPYEASAADADGITGLMIAARYGFVGIIEELMSKEAGMLNTYGQTALMVAVQNNKGTSHINAIKVLVRGESKCTDNSGVTALMWAAFSGQAEVVKLLMEEAGLSTNANHDKGAGFTALMAAASVGSAAVVEFLLPLEGKMKQSNGKTVRDYAKNKTIKDLLDMFL